MYMSPIAGITAGPNGLKFFKGTQGYPGGNIGKKNQNKNFNFLFHGQRRALQLASYTRRYVLQTNFKL